MKLISTLAVLLWSWPLFAQEISNAQRIQAITELKKFAFGSCNNHRYLQPIWQGMIKNSPDLFIWGGDNVYANTKSIELIKYSYDIQNAQADYKQLKSQTPIIGTWDDHDFGYDNAWGNFLYKDLSQRLALDFFEEPMDSPRRLQQGIYTSYDFGEGNRKVKIILLDNRYFKGLDRAAPFLGIPQWTWLEEEIKNSDAKIHFIMSGLTVTGPWYPGGEEWKDSAQDSARLWDMIEKYQPKGLVFLSGDKHFANINQRYGFLEFMASGMTHTVPFGVRKFVASSFGGTSFFGLNYGLIEIEWPNHTPLLRMHIKNREGKSIFTHEYLLSNNAWVRIDSPQQLRQNNP